MIHSIRWLIAEGDTFTVLLIFDGNGVMDIPGDDQAPA